MFVITKWTRHVTDDKKDKYTGKSHDNLPYKFRLLDDDGVVYAYGYSNDDSDFGPLDCYMYSYGVTEIQYKNPVTKEYETL